jgi:hypothetical protein
MGLIWVGLRWNTLKSVGFRFGIGKNKEVFLNPLYTNLQNSILARSKQNSHSAGVGAKHWEDHSICNSFSSPNALPLRDMKGKLDKSKAT